MAGVGIATLPVVTTIPITITDEIGNPLPPEVLVGIYGINSGPLPSELLDSAYIGADSTINVNVGVGGSYRLQFYGNRIPPNTIAFATDVVEIGQTVVVQNYIGPVVSEANYVAEQQALWPTGWIDPNGKNALLIAKVLASLIYTLGQQVALITSGERLLSSAGALVDSWANDFFGNTLPRFRNEPDTSYIARIESELQSDNTTLAAIASKTRAFLVLQATFNQQQVFALDTSGGLDTYGGLDDAGTSTVVPTVSAFDWQSDPDRSALIGLGHGQVCVLFTYPGVTKTGFFAGQSYLGYSSYLLTAQIRVVGAPSALIDAYVQSVVALGIEVVYADNRTP